jgi:meso-butanediol dehydrogenase/(S,S)-butanediol dehydrogenase/diacetyl reductase
MADVPDERVALVTGAGRGIGRAIALRLAESGYRVVVNDLDPELADATAAAIGAAGGRASAAPADVADVSAGASLVARTVEDLGRLDALVNNAGLIRFGPFGEVTEADWDRIFEVNVRGLFFLMQTAAAVMVEQGHGSIVNMASIVGRGAPTLSPPYAASKAAIINLTQSAAKQLAPAGIRVNAVCPGLIDTDLNALLDRAFGVERQGRAEGEYLRERAAGVPMQRLGEPEEVATVVDFLLSDAASYVTGQALNIDGGILVN